MELTLLFGISKRIGVLLFLIISYKRREDDSGESETMLPLLLISCWPVPTNNQRLDRSEGILGLIARQLIWSKK